MIIESSVIKTNQTIFDKFFNFGRLRVNHSNDWLIFPFVLPVNKKQIRKDFYIKERNRSFIIRNTLARLLRLKLHVINNLNAIFSLISTISSKRKYSILHVANIVTNTAVISIFKVLIHEVYRALSGAMVFLIEITFEKSTKHLLILNPIKVNHFFISLQRQSRANCRDLETVALG